MNDLKRISASFISQEPVVDSSFPTKKEWLHMAGQVMLIAPSREVRYGTPSRQD